MYKQEIQLLLRAPSSSTDIGIEARQEVLQALAVALEDLSHAVGLRTHTLTTNSTPGSSKQTNVISVDGAQLSMILQPNKGRKLLTRCIGILSNEQRYYKYT